MNSRACNVVWALGLACICSCNVGAPLVDTFERSGGNPAIKCKPVPPCVALLDGELELGQATPIDRSDCAGPDASACDADAGVSERSAADGCSEHAGLPLVAACQELRIHGPSDEGLTTLEAPDWSRSNLTLAARAPWRIALHGPTLASVFVRLEGPVRLHIDHLVGSDDLRIAGVTTAAGAPSIELVQASARALIIGDMARTFAGAVNLQDVTMAESLVTGDTLEMQSAVVTNARIAATTLTGTDASLTDTVIDADTVLLSALTALRSHIRACGGATYVASTLQQSTVSACSEASVIHMYGGKVLSSVVEGSIDSDGSNWENTRFGPTTPTAAVFFQSSVSSAAFCDAVTDVAFGIGTRVECSSCERAPDAPTFCIVPSEGQSPEISVNYCVPLSGDAPLPQCEDPSPQRIRPEHAL